VRDAIEAPMQPDIHLGFDHRYVVGDGKRAALTLLLLHGTGGDGDSLLQLGYTVAPGATLLSPTGQIREGESRRFFRRLAEGVFDQQDLAVRTRDLRDFVRAATSSYGLDPHRIVAVGYSNGANIASSLMFRCPDVLAGAVLFRPMVPFVPENRPDLSGVPVLMCVGAYDHLSPVGDAERLGDIFRFAGADVTLHSETAGHELSLGDISAARDWIEENFAD
jgi:predicted esterase